MNDLHERRVLPNGWQESKSAVAIAYYDFIYQPPIYQPPIRDGGHRWCVLRRKDTKKFWLGKMGTREDDDAHDVGPFDDMETAMAIALTRNALEGPRE